MYELSKNVPKDRHVTSQFCFVQPIHSRLMINVENPVYEYFNAKYLSYTPSEVLPRTKNSKLKHIKTCDSCINPIFQTNKGFEVCPCGKNLENRLQSVTEIQESPTIKEVIEDKKIKNDQVIRSVSCEDDYGENFKRDNRRVSILVDELLLKIYGDRDRKFSSGGTDLRDTIDCSTDSSSNIALKNNVLLKRKRSFSGIPDDKCLKWNALIRARLMSKSLNELKSLKEGLEYNITHTGSQLIRQLKRRDLLFSRRDAQYNILTAFLQAKSAKRSEDTKMQFSMKPSAGESGFQQWHSAMKMVARLPGGIPHEFRKTLWLTLAERHISSRKINWHQVERSCFNDSTNPDDEELGVQIVKDLHRTGCSLFCGTSGEQNQAVLKRVLLAYARWNKYVGYCQGFNMLAALILEVMDRCEYDSLKVMIYLIEGVLPESYFANSLRGLSIDMAVFRDLLRLKLPELSKHLEQLQTGSNDAGNTYEPPLTNVFTMQWFLTLFCNCLPHSTVLRVWDLVFLEGNQVLLKTALAIWDTLSDRIMPVKSADEFYSIMGVLTREMLEFGLMDANCLVKTITSIELLELTELRERYIYNITPWTQVARKGLRLFYSDDESDDSDDEQNDDKVSEGAYGFLKAATKHGSQSIRSISPSSILSPFAGEKEKIALDISALKKQYCKIKERQRQAQIIFTAACNTHGLMGSMVSSTPSPPINHLLLNKTPTVAKNTKVQKTPAIPLSRAVQRLKESSSSIADDSSKDRGETVYWDKRVKKKRRRKRIDLTSQKSFDSKEQTENHVDSDSSYSSSSSASLKSSTSTELCDDLTEFDSDNTSLSECCSSPLYRIQSSTVLVPEDDKQDEPEVENEERNTVGYEEREHTILNVLLTTSIMVNEQLNQSESSDKLEEPDENLTRLDNAITKNELDLKIDELVCDSQSCDITVNAISQDIKVSEDITGHVTEHVSNELESELEHMKIDALEILFSSSTLESIKNESFPTTENFMSFDIPVIVTEGETSFENQDTIRSNSSRTSPVEESDKISVSQLEFTYGDEYQNLENKSLDRSEIVEDLLRYSPEKESINLLDEDLLRQTPEKESISESDKVTNDQQFSFNNLINFSNEYKPSDELLDFRDAFPVKEIPTTVDLLENNPSSWSWESSESYTCGKESNSASLPANSADILNDKSSMLPLEIFDNQYNLDVHQTNKKESLPDDSNQEMSQDEQTVISSLPLESDVNLKSLCDSESPDTDKCDHNEQLNNTETALENILRENTEVLKKVYHKYTSSQSCDFDAVSSYRDLCSDGEPENLPRSRLKKDIKFLSLDYPIHLNELKKRPRRKHKSLDNLNTKKSKLKIGLLSKNCKWISISIDNSDLALLNAPPENNKSAKSEFRHKISSRGKSSRISSIDNGKKKDLNSAEYLHLNFDIISTKKKKDPIEEYVHKKNVLSQSFKSPSELAPLNFNPFPSRSNTRPPKELGVKLGLYSSNKK